MQASIYINLSWKKFRGWILELVAAAETRCSIEQRAFVRCHLMLTGKSEERQRLVSHHSIFC